MISKVKKFDLDKLGFLALIWILQYSVTADIEPNEILLYLQYNFFKFVYFTLK